MLKLSIDLTEEPLTLDEVVRLPVFRRNGKKPHVSAVYRWISQGTIGAGGQRVKLQTFRAPGGLRTNRRLVELFINQLSGRLVMPSPTAARKQQVAKAEQELLACGFEVGGPAD